MDQQEQDQAREALLAEHLEIGAVIGAALVRLGLGGDDLDLAGGLRRSTVCTWIRFSR